MLPKKNVTCKKSTSQNGQYLSTRRQNNFKLILSPMSCLLILTILTARKLYMLRFLGTPYTLPTLS